MVLTSLLRGLKSASGRQATRTRRPGRQRAPQRSVPAPLFLERLEDRALPSFLAPLSFAAGSQPRSVAVGNFNGDGRLDLAVANYNSNNVSVLLGNGDGTFQTARNFAAGIGPSSVVMGNFNGDGHADLAVTGAINLIDGTVSVLLGNGDGTFQPARTFAAGPNPFSLAVGEFNGDSWQDLVTTNTLEVCGEKICEIIVSEGQVRLGNGDGTFQAARTFSTGLVPLSVAVGEFNGDGRPDLAVVNGRPPTVSVVLGNGDGSFQAPRHFVAGTSPASIAVGEFNGDGRPDLAVINGFSTTVSVLLGNGDGTFQPSREFIAGPGPRSVVAADFNHDGTSDLAVATTAGGVRVLLGNGDGIFQAPQTFAAGSVPQSVAVEDFNGDGRPDLAVANGGSNDVSVLLNVPDPAVTLQVTALAPSRSGFLASFSRPLDPIPLNLYDAAGALGPADVTLTGAATGPVAGTLILSPDRAGITFVKTGGPLLADTYTVRLRSAANGFKDAMGALLDGNADGTPGDDHVATFTVSAPAPVVVSIADFLRGPGQPVNVPATGTGLPLRLSEAAGVRAVSLTLRYDPRLLRVTGAATALPGARVTLDTRTPGQAVLLFTSPTPLTAGPIDFVTLTASVPDTAPYGSKQELDLSAVQVGVAAGALVSWADDGIQVVGYFGDATGNAGYSSTDATRILRVAVGLDSGFDAYQLADPVVVADITGNGILSSTDASRVLQEALGFDRPEIPPPGTAPPFTLGGPDPFLNFPTDFTARPGDMVTVPLLLDLSDGLESADVAISYDPRRLEVAAVQRGDLTEDFDLFAVNFDPEQGSIRVGLGRTAGAIASRGSGSVLVITFQVRTDALAGPVVINLRQAVEQTLTQLNEGRLDLIPDPSDEEGDILDGLITILGGTATLPPKLDVSMSQEDPLGDADLAALLNHPKALPPAWHAETTPRPQLTAWLVEQVFRQEAAVDAGLLGPAPLGLRAKRAPLGELLSKLSDQGGISRRLGGSLVPVGTWMSTRK